MNFLELLGRALKDDEVIELLEDEEVEVTYDFDRLFEGTEDEYNACFHDGGFALKFNAEQQLVTMFLHVVETDEYQAADIEDEALPLYSTYDEAKAAFQSAGVEIATPPDGQGWIKGVFPQYTAHYQYGPELQMITVSAISK